MKKHQVKGPICGLALAFLLLGTGCKQEEAPKAAPAEGHHEPAVKGEAAPMAFDGLPPVGTKATCPVEKETFVVGQKSEHSTHKGKTYVFCCADCKPEFDKEPEKFAVPQ